MKNKKQQELLLTLTNILEKYTDNFLKVEIRLTMIEQELKRVHPDITLLTDEKISKFADTMKKLKED